MDRRAARRAKAAAVSERPRTDWLSRALARAGVLPLHEAELAIRAGRVKLHGRVVVQPLTPLPPNARVQLDGAVISLASERRVWMFHKPAGVVTGPEGTHRLFAEQLPPALRRFEWHCGGRLDKDTTGLLLFTNDPRVIEHVTSPKARLTKTYVARVFGTVTEEKLARLRGGIVLNDGRARAVGARVLEPQTIELQIDEGRFHQVKRMLGAVGLPVRALHRSAIGDVQLDVAEGKARALSDEEIGNGLDE